MSVAPNLRATLASFRTDPYRPLFLEGVLLVWFGVFHWLLLGLGVIGQYLAIFHSLTQVQGFMTCFALGFLLTFVPRRTGTPPPAGWEVAVAMIAPPGLVALAGMEKWAASQIFWLVLMVMVLRFLISRMRGARAAPLPSGFLWVPVAFSFSLVGVVLTAVGAAGGDETMWIHDIGRSMILQGLFTGFVVGVGGTLLPGFLYGQPPQEDPPTRRRRRLVHLAAVAVLFGSFWVEVVLSIRAGFAMRALVALGLLSMARLYRRPTLPGLQRVLMWIACWMLPAGFALVAAFPAYRRIGLHVVFIGCFALLAFSVSVQVMLSHRGRADLLGGSPWTLRAFAGLMLLALCFRALLDLDPRRFSVWISAAASCFLAATLLWAATVLRRPATSSSGRGSAPSRP